MLQEKKVILKEINLVLDFLFGWHIYLGLTQIVSYLPLFFLSDFAEFLLSSTAFFDSEVKILSHYDLDIYG